MLIRGRSVALYVSPALSAPSIPGPTSVSLTAYNIAAGATAGVQRDIGATTGSPKFAGTYSGGTPTGFQGRIRKVADNSVVVDWTNLTNLTFGSGTFSGKLRGVPQGNGYYREVRATNAPTVIGASTTPFLIGIGILMYGQSNMAFLSTLGTGASPVAHVDTTWFDGTKFSAVPPADGLRLMLNAVRTNTGVPCFALNAAIAGKDIGALSSPGDGTSFIAMTNQVTGAGGDLEIIAWHQGEGDSNGGAPSSHYQYVSKVDTLHSQLCALVGRTKAQMPWVGAGLSTVVGGGTSYLQWQDIQRGIQLVDNPADNKFFSHGQVDIPNDGLHYTAQGRVQQGQRYGQGLSYALGAVTKKPTVYIKTVTAVNNTTVDVTVQHSLGTDFQVTSGMTGFEVSEDGGKTWVACTAARTSSDTLRLTHAATTRNRILMYGRGLLPDMSVPVRDNSPINAALVNTALPIEVEKENAPFADWMARVNLPAVSPWLNYSGSIPAGQGYPGRRFIIVGCYPGTTAAIATNGFKVNGAAATVHYNPAAAPAPNAFVASIKNEVDTTLNFDITFTAGFFAGLLFDVYEVNESNLVSKVPTSNSYAETNATTSATLTIDTQDGGFVLAQTSSTYVAAGTTADISGSTVVERFITQTTSGQTTRSEVGHNTLAETASINSTFSGSGNIGLVATAWR